MNDNGEKVDFNELVKDCAGKDRKEQERYLSRVVMQLVIKRYGRDPQLPDANYLRAHGVDVKDVFKAMQVLDAVYSVLSNLLLDTDDAELNDIRLEVQKLMRNDLKTREDIQNAAGIL